MRFFPSSVSCVLCLSSSLNCWTLVARICICIYVTDRNNNFKYTRKYPLIIISCALGKYLLSICLYMLSTHTLPIHGYTAYQKSRASLTNKFNEHEIEVEYKWNCFWNWEKQRNCSYWHALNTPRPPLSTKVLKPIILLPFVHLLASLCTKHLSSNTPPPPPPPLPACPSLLLLILKRQGVSERDLEMNPDVWLSRIQFHHRPMNPCPAG